MKTKESSFISDNFKKKIKHFKDIIADVDCLSTFYKDTNSLLEEKKQRIEKKYKVGLFVANELDKLFSSDRQTIDKRIEETKEIELPNGKKLKDIINISPIKKESDDSLSFTIHYSIDSDGDNSSDPVYAKKVMQECESEQSILRSSVLEYIIIIFEEFLASCYLLLLVEEPNRYIGEKSVKVSDLFDGHFLISSLFEKEVSNSMYDSMGCLSKISEKSKINVDRVEVILPYFKELYYRRNILVHNSGVVNSTYLDSIDDCIHHPKNGEKLKTDSEYIEKGLACLIKILTSLAYEVSIVLKPIRENWKDSIASYGFQCLTDGRYEIAEFIYKMLKADKNNDFLHRLMYMVNYLNAKKQQGKSIGEELSGLDVSATTNDYKIAKLCLEDKNEDVYQMLCDTYPESFSADNIRTWPIFINFRNTSYYKMFIEKHQVDFDVFEYPDDTDKANDSNPLLIN